jgi:hypothetical protein
MWEVRFDGPTLGAVLSRQLGALEDARGDVKGASERLREQVLASQNEVQSAQEALAARRQEAVDKLKELDLTGREISFESGVSRATVTGFMQGDLLAVPEEHDLTGVVGTIVGAEAGTLWGREVAEANTIVLHVSVRGSLIPPKLPHNYLVHADEAAYSIGEAPQPDD